MLIVFLISIPGIWGLRAGLAGEEGPVIDALTTLYWPAFVVAHALFGGFHNAPGWSVMPAIVIASVGQTLLVWNVFKWLYRWIGEPS
jgi:hypothetical protein